MGESEQIYIGQCPINFPVYIENVVYEYTFFVIYFVLRTQTESVIFKSLVCPLNSENPLSDYFCVHVCRLCGGHNRFHIIEYFLVVFGGVCFIVSAFTAHFCLSQQLYAYI